MEQLSLLTLLEEDDKGRPCVRALNAMCREKRIEIDYSDMNFERWF